MKLNSSGLIAVLSLAALGLPAPAKTKVKAHAEQPPRRNAQHAAAAHPSKTAPHGKPAQTAQRGGTSHNKTARGRVTTHSRSTPRQATQASPSSDRYREIQEALASKGYLKTPPTGAWDPASIDAMKRFQEDQKLTSTGKLNSLSLIALGLGPKLPEK